MCSIFVCEIEVFDHLARARRAKKNISIDFRKHSPNCLVIIDCFEYSLIDQGFFQVGGGGAFASPLALACPPLGYAENSILHVNQ